MCNYTSTVCNLVIVYQKIRHYSWNMTSVSSFQSFPIVTWRTTFCTAGQLNMANCCVAFCVAVNYRQKYNSVRRAKRATANQLLCVNSARLHLSHFNHISWFLLQNTRLVALRKCHRKQKPHLNYLTFSKSLFSSVSFVFSRFASQALEWMWDWEPQTSEGSQKLNCDWLIGF